MICLWRGRRTGEANDDNVRASGYVCRCRCLQTLPSEHDRHQVEDSFSFEVVETRSLLTSKVLETKGSRFSSKQQAVPTKKYRYPNTYLVLQYVAQLAGRVGQPVDVDYDTDSSNRHIASHLREYEGDWESSRL